MQCTSPLVVSGLVAAGAIAVTLLVCSRDLHRGIADVGFVGTALRAERSRRDGL